MHPARPEQKPNVVDSKQMTTKLWSHNSLPKKKEIAK